MSSRAGTEAARLRRLKREARLLGLTILSTKKMPPAGGGYMLSHDETRRVVIGDRPAPFSASLDAIESYLVGLSVTEK